MEDTFVNGNTFDLQTKPTSKLSSVLRPSSEEMNSGRYSRRMLSAGTGKNPYQKTDHLPQSVTDCKTPVSFCSGKRKRPRIRLVEYREQFKLVTENPHTSKSVTFNFEQVSKLQTA